MRIVTALWDVRGDNPVEGHHLVLRATEATDLANGTLSRGGLVVKVARDPRGDNQIRSEHSLIREVLAPYGLAPALRNDDAHAGSVKEPDWLAGRPCIEMIDAGSPLGTPLVTRVLRGKELEALSNSLLTILEKTEELELEPLQLRPEHVVLWDEDPTRVTLTGWSGAWLWSDQAPVTDLAAGRLPSTYLAPRVAGLYLYALTMMEADTGQPPYPLADGGQTHSALNELQARGDGLDGVRDVWRQCARGDFATAREVRDAIARDRRIPPPPPKRRPWREIKIAVGKQYLLCPYLRFATIALAVAAGVGFGLTVGGMLSGG